jgi:hypothetical protein
VTGRHRIADAALDLHPEDERRQRVAAGHCLRFGKRQYRCGDGRGGMDDRIQMSVVEIEEIGRNRVDERRAQHVEPFLSSDDCRCRGTTERRHHA